MPKIATILHYCTNDFRFIHRAIEECLHFSDQIIIPFASHFFDQSPENRFLLELTMERYPQCTFVHYPFDVKRLYTPFIQAEPFDQDWLCCWHSTSRYIGNFFVKQEIEWVFFLDADEIVEGERFKEWSASGLAGDELAFWFYAYMYGASASQRKEEQQLTGLLLKKNALVPQQLLSPQERCGMYQAIDGKKRMEVVGLDLKPLIHHYSWVRSAEECAKKATTWAKKDQKNWLEWLKNSQGKTTPVVPYFDPLSVFIPSGIASNQTRPNEHLVDRRQIMEFEHALL